MVQSPSSGSLQRNASGDLIFTPDANYAGIVQFSYCVTDGEWFSNTVTSTIQVVLMASSPAPSPSSSNSGTSQASSSTSGSASSYTAASTSSVTAGSPEANLTTDGPTSGVVLATDGVGTGPDSRSTGTLTASDVAQTMIADAHGEQAGANDDLKQIDGRLTANFDRILQRIGTVYGGIQSS